MVDVNLGAPSRGRTWRVSSTASAAARSSASDRSRATAGAKRPCTARPRRPSPPISKSLRNRLAERAVRVVTIKPGMVETPMTAHLEKLVMPVTAERAAREILSVARGRLWNVRHVPLRWLPVSLIIRSIRPCSAGRTSEAMDSAARAAPGEAREQPRRGLEYVEGWGMAVGDRSRVWRRRALTRSPSPPGPRARRRVALRGAGYGRRRRHQHPR